MTDDVSKEAAQLDEQTATLLGSLSRGESEAWTVAPRPSTFR